LTGRLDVMGGVMAARLVRPGSRPSAALSGEIDDEFWGSEYPAIGRSLLSSAVDCFAKQGFQATTTRDIGTGSGLSAAALYVHFPSKEDALFAIMRVGHRRDSSDYSANPGDTGDEPMPFSRINHARRRP